MIKLKNILVIALLMTSMALAARDNNSDNDRQNKWMNEYREYKQEFLFHRTIFLEDQQHIQVNLL